VVERFIEIQPSVAQELSGSVEQAFERIARTARPRTETPVACVGERETMAAVFEVGREMASAADAGAAVAAAHASLKRLMPVDTTTLYVYDSHCDALTVECAAGLHEEALAAMTIGRGQRLSGWVAAHGRSVVNSDAALDLGNLVVSLQPTPLSCLSAPVRWDGEIVGVLTLYSSAPEPFTGAHEGIAEVVAMGVAPFAARASAARPARQSASGKGATLRLVGHS
jgi:transcriptional regulator with GAF, ATPase, and Fis domain